MPCTIIYKYAKIFQTGNFFLSIFGRCSICESVLNGVIKDPPVPNSRVVIKCSYVGAFRSCKNGYKRRIIGKKRDELAENLIQQNMSASYVQKMEAKKVILNLKMVILNPVVYLQ